MNFYEAYKQIRQGMVVRRLSEPTVMMGLSVNTAKDLTYGCVVNMETDEVIPVTHKMLDAKDFELVHTSMTNLSCIDALSFLMRCSHVKENKVHCDAVIRRAIWPITKFVRFSARQDQNHKSLLLMTDPSSHMNRIWELKYEDMIAQDWIAIIPIKEDNREGL